MIVTNEQIQNGDFDEAILKQVKTLCKDWKIRYSNSWGNDNDTRPFELGFKVKDTHNYT